MKTRYNNITKDILIALALAGVFTIACTSPYFLTNMAKFILNNKKYKSKYKDANIKNLSKSLAGLNKNKIIIVKEDKNGFRVSLTENGKKVVAQIQFENMKIEKQKIWDKKWRMIIFDIPEKKGKNARNALTIKLKNIGFYQMQKSVWVCPYPCEKEIQLVCEIFQINPYVNIVTAEKIYNDDIIKKYFKL